MNRIIAACLVVAFIPGCDDVGTPPRGGSGDGYGAFEGDLSSDAAYDELSAVIEDVATRNDQLTELKGFSSVDVPSVRANVVILTNLISTFEGGASVIDKARYDRWSTAIADTFDDPDKWGFQPWPEEEKKTWRRACEADMANLRRLLVEDW